MPRRAGVSENVEKPTVWFCNDLFHLLTYPMFLQMVLWEWKTCKGFPLYVRSRVMVAVLCECWRDAKLAEGVGVVNYSRLKP